MAGISYAAAFGKLNPLAFRSIQSAHQFCKQRGNAYVELVHWLHQMLQLMDSDVHRIVRHFDIEPSRLEADITRTLNGLPRGATAVSDFSPHIIEAVERAWVYATLLYRDDRVRTGYVLVGIAKTPALAGVLRAVSPQFDRINADQLAERLDAIVAGSPEDALGASDGSQLRPTAQEPAADGAPGAAAGPQEALNRFTVDLTAEARQGRIDPVVGRDEEIRQVVDILMRRRQNNPILTGEAGVGKTAVVEGFARRIAEGDVPPMLKDVALRTLDVGLLQAGAGVRGEFENRLRQVIDEVRASPKPIVLFIDEAHTLIGAGGAAGTGDAANLLKPALARGTLRTIAATTWAEYKKHIEKDPALTRRFQVVQVHEPDELKAVRMMRGVASTLEAHHRVQLLDEAIEAAVKLSRRYIPARQLPDKSVSVLDTACARVAVSQHATPAEVEDCRRRIEALEIELAIIGREEAVGIDVGGRRGEVEAAIESERTRLEVLEARWRDEKELVDEILALRARLRAAGGNGGGEEAQPDEAERAELLVRLRELQGRLAELQGEAPLILPTVDSQAVASVIGDWTGIPVGRMVKDEIAAVLKLTDTLKRRVIGQDHGLEMIARRIETARAGLENPNKPIGVFLLCGPSGVGKTETALALAEAFYGGEQNMITINMSEFQEAHTVSTLKGAPPGYVGYGEGGRLTEAVRRRPYSVVLLDEVEKAHPDVHELFFQVFDKGALEDGEGRMIDFKNTLILLTSNVGSDLIMNMCADPDLMPEPEGIAQALRQPLLKVFPAALLGRLVTIPYYPLSDAMIRAIIELQLGRVQRRVTEQHGVPFTYDDDVLRLIAERCTELESGGRMIDSILTNTVLPRISREFLTRMSEGGAVARVHIGVADGGFSYRFD